MPNHHIVEGADPEKGHAAYEKEEPYVLGAATVADASGRGGNTHRGLKSRHIQFLYVPANQSAADAFILIKWLGLLVVPLEPVFSSALDLFSLSLALRPCSWRTCL